MDNYLSQVLHREDAQLLGSAFIKRRFKAKEFFTVEGKRSNQIGFVNSGLAHSFYTDEYGDYKTVCFSAERMWVFDPISYFSEAGSKFSIQFLEDSIVSMANRQTIEELCETNKHISILIRKMIEQSYVFMLDRLITNNSQTAKDRYLMLMDHYPDIFLRVPLRLIASYIGVTESSLSRIRANLKD